MGPKERLKQARYLFYAAHGVDLTQNEIGELAGFASGLWSQWETGKKPLVRPATLDKIAAMFSSAGMPYVTRFWLEHGFTKPGDPAFPELITGLVSTPVAATDEGDDELPKPEAAALPREGDEPKLIVPGAPGREAANARKGGGKP